MVDHKGIIDIKKCKEKWKILRICFDKLLSFICLFPGNFSFIRHKNINLSFFTIFFFYLSSIFYYQLHVCICLFVTWLDDNLNGMYTIPDDVLCVFYDFCLIKYLIKKNLKQINLIEEMICHQTVWEHYLL